MNKNYFLSSQKIFNHDFKAAKICLILVALFFILAPPVLAATLDTGLNYGTYTGLGTQDLRVMIMKIVRVILGLVGIIAIIIVIYGGYIWMTSGGSPDKIDKAKRILTNAVIGLVIIFSAFAIVSFIIRSLEGALGGTGERPGGAPPAGCENCGHLGSGIIESVYPAPQARDVARNTNIMVTFKVAMNPSTIVNGCSTVPCSGDLISNNVKIFRSGKDEDDDKLGNTDVIASTNDGKTFVFNPKDYLGDGVNNIWYAVKLTKDIEKDNGDSAFPGANNYFLWTFEIGSFLDLDPVEISSVFPEPDDTSDSYNVSSAVQSSGSITVLTIPQIAEQAAISDIVNEGLAPEVVISGDYNCSVDSFICVSTSDGTNFAIHPKAGTATACTAPDISVSGLNSSATITSGNSINPGCGLTLGFSASFSGGTDLWHFKAKAAKAADTLSVDTKTYAFVGVDAITDSNQINIGASIAETAANIAAKISGNNLAVIVDPAYSSGSDEISLKAKIAGAKGDSIRLSAGTWADITEMSGGKNPSFAADIEDAPDKARNAAIIIDFNEPINPIEVPDAITVQYNNDPANPNSWQTVAASYLISNQYQTVEILSNTPCTDPDTGAAVTNSCGDQIYCWPFNNPDPYEATNYRVLIKAGKLVECTVAGGCNDPNYNYCVDINSDDNFTNLVCNSESDASGFNYPEAMANPEGIIDAASNSFNGNKNTYILNSKTYGKAEGPQEQNNQAAYSLNLPLDNTGDDLIWSFFINKDLDLSPSNVIEIGPPIGADGISLTAPIEATFDEVMLSSSLKPGSNYRDGYCYCDASSDVNNKCSDTQSCDDLLNRCKSTTDSPQYCLEDSDCPDNDDSTPEKRCINKKYVTLIDQATFAVGWWITKNNLDLPPRDTYADQTMVLINHTNFAQVTNYGAELGSGIKDAYQNCYLPSKGPNNSVRRCSVTTATVCGTDKDCPSGERCVATCDPSDASCCVGPYCCDGQAMDEDAWKNSPCFTGF